jgi:hypothetical protein
MGARAGLRGAGARPTALQPHGTSRQVHKTTAAYALHQMFNHHGKKLREYRKHPVFMLCAALLTYTPIAI